MNNARVALSYTTIQSPLDGRTGNVAAKAGNLVTANSTELMIIAQMQPVYVTFAVPAVHPPHPSHLAEGHLMVTATPETEAASHRPAGVRRQRRRCLVNRTIELKRQRHKYRSRAVAKPVHAQSHATTSRKIIGSEQTLRAKAKGPLVVGSPVDRPADGRRSSSRRAFGRARRLSGRAAAEPGTVVQTGNRRRGATRAKGSALVKARRTRRRAEPCCRVVREYL